MSENSTINYPVPHGVMPLTLRTMPDPSTHSFSAGQSPHQTFIYILTIDDRSRIKIGFSANPPGRISGLFNINPEIDLSRSVIISVDSRQIETVLHAIFQPRRQKRVPRCDGYTEWFSGDFADEVIDLCHRIAQHRCVSYGVVRDLRVLIATHRRTNPLSGLQAPRMTKAQRQARLPHILKSLTEAMIDQTTDFIDVLSERDFDAVLCKADQYFLVRTVHREEAPECWEPGNGGRASAWSDRLLDAAQISVRVDGGACRFHLLNPPIFERLSDEEAREYYRICERPDGETETPGRSDITTDSAFRVLWEALAHLAVRSYPNDSLGDCGLVSHNAKKAS